MLPNILEIWILSDLLGSEFWLFGYSNLFLDWINRIFNDVCTFEFIRWLDKSNFFRCLHIRICLFILIEFRWLVKSIFQILVHSNLFVDWTNRIFSVVVIEFRLWLLWSNFFDFCDWIWWFRKLWSNFSMSRISWFSVEIFKSYAKKCVRQCLNYKKSLPSVNFIPFYIPVLWISRDIMNFLNFTG